MFKLSTTDFRFRTALVVAAGMMSLSGFMSHNDLVSTQETSSMASQAPKVSPEITAETGHQPASSQKDKTPGAADAAPTAQ